MAIVLQVWVKPMPIRITPKLNPRNANQFAAPALERTIFFISCYNPVRVEEYCKHTLGISKILRKTGSQMVPDIESALGEYDLHIRHEKDHDNNSVSITDIKS